MKGDLLLIIDMQNVYTRGAKWECRDTAGAAKNILRLAQSEKFDEVILTKFIADENARGVWKTYNIENAAVNKDAWSNELLPELEPLAKKFPVVQKSKYSSLKNERVLAACKNAQRVFVTGVVAECCVLFTAFDLIDAGIYTVYVTDAVSGLNEEKERAAELTLEGLSPLHVQLMTTDEILQEE
ncbi:MAG: cysteine hydrolase [Treponemataceae bacterium]|nr:cysteine hydrolase [Treponemataceae bacterium]